MRDEDERAGIVLERQLERRAHVEIEVVRRFVEEQEIRTRANDEREREARLFAAREVRDGLVHAIAAEVEAAQEGAGGLSSIAGSSRRRWTSGEASGSSCSS